jgi:hypothetical protein
MTYQCSCISAEQNQTLITVFVNLVSYIEINGSRMNNPAARSEPLSTVRKSIFPHSDDTWESVAARELPDTPLADAVGMLQSFNLHVFMRPSAPADSPRAGNPLLPSDVIFLEAPLG